MTEKFLLRGEDTYHLAPFKYPWAYEMFKNEWKGTWVPEEINMTQDKFCYEQQLTPDERWLFKHAFATLTTQDLAVSSNLIERIHSTIKAPEVRLYLTRQIGTEGLHSHSYQHCIECIGMDQEEVYTMYRTVPAMAQWFGWCRDTQAEGDDIIMPIMQNYGIVESVFFITTFSCLYSLARMNKMTGTGTQIRFIHLEESNHVAFGTKLLRELFAEMGTRPPESAVYAMYEEAIHRIQIWADYCIPSILGFNKDLYMEQIRYNANRRLRSLGYEPIFTARNVMPWLDELASDSVEAAFFEKRVTAYQSSAGLHGTWEATGMDDIVNWKA